MFSRGGRGEENGLLSVVIGVIALLALLGNSKRARRHARRASGSLAKGGGPLKLVWLIGGFLLFMGLMSLLSSIGSGAAAGLGLMFCLAPGAALVFLGLAAYRASERNKQGSAQGSQSAAAEPAPQQQKQPAASIPLGQPAKPAAPAASAPTAAPARTATKPEPAKVVRKPPPQPVKNPAEYRERAIGYRRRIQSLIKSRRRGPLADLMNAILPRLEGWEARVGQLADRLVNFETDKLIQRDIKEVPSNIERMQALWEAESDPATRKQIERTLAGYKEQRAQLDALARLMRRTRFVLDDTLASMGTIYSQVQVLDAMDIDSARAARIGEEIQEQVDKLNDVLSAFSDVNQLPVDEVDEIDEAARRIRLEKGGTTASSS